MLQHWIWISFYLSPRNSFLGPNLIQKTYKKMKLSSKEMCWVIFSQKNLTYWFLKAYCEISAHTDVPNLFFHFELLICHELKPCCMIANMQEKQENLLFEIEWRLLEVGRLKLGYFVSEVWMLGKKYVFYLYFSDLFY